jgi:hypothetical protein
MDIGITLSRTQLETWAERTLTDNEVDRLAAALSFSSVPEAVATIAASFVDERTWTFFGHWDDNDKIVIDGSIEGVHEDTRVDYGQYPGGLWSDSGTGTTPTEAQADAVRQYNENL